MHICVAFVHPDHDGRAVTNFRLQLKLSGWIHSSTKCFFPHYGDSVAGHSSVIIAAHDSTQSKVELLLLRTPPSPRPLPLVGFIWQPFNTCEYSVSLAKDDALFGKPSSNGMIAAAASDLVIGSFPDGIQPMYFLHLRKLDTKILAGVAILSLDSLCPPFDGLPNTNIFGSRFGVEFHVDGNTHIRSILAFEFTSCFGLMDHLQFCLSQHLHWYALDGGIPALTSVWIFDHILDRLLLIRNSNMEIFPPNQFAAPAAHIQAFVNGVVATRLPDHDRCIQAIVSDPELSAIKDIVTNPSTLSNTALAGIYYNYHTAVRQSLIVLEDGLLIYCKPLHGMESYTHLQLVPWEFQNILFIAFHSNPLGGHLNAYCTLHRLRLQYYWPGMFTYIKKMCAACPG
jgi:hypothetical protein